MVMHEIVPADRVGIAAYRAMFEHSSEGVLFSTPDGRITAANPAACACSTGRRGDLPARP